MKVAVLLHGRLTQDPESMYISLKNALNNMDFELYYSNNGENDITDFVNLTKPIEYASVPIDVTQFETYINAAIEHDPLHPYRLVEDVYRCFLIEDAF
jgi:hypothetical protein